MSAPRLKTYTQYRCTKCGTIRWAGAYSRPSPGDELHCGQPWAEVVDNGVRWRVSWEIVGPFDAGWCAISRETNDELSARDQVAGLVKLIAEGELIRNVRLERSTATWESVEL